jgi:hypothetical protein
MGLGIRFKGTLENRSMAGVAVEQDSIHMNPASYGLLSYNFTLGTCNFKETTESAKATRTTLDYMAVDCLWVS